jgi:hypothetical protein
MSAEKKTSYTPGWNFLERVPLPRQNKKRERSPTWNWARGWWIRQANKRRKERLQQDVRERKSAVNTIQTHAH